jgi:molybdenum cofactor guanylyltransferase
MRTAGGAEPDGGGFDTVVLAGGRAARLNGADKPSLEVGGTPLLVLVARAAAGAGTLRLIIVGPKRTGTVRAGLAALAGQLSGGIVSVREEPPGAGPVPALRRGLAEVTAPLVAVLAADLPFLTGAELDRVLAAVSSRPPDRAAGHAGRPAQQAGRPAGAVLTDQAGREQWLAGAWQAEPLRRALADYRGGSLGGLLAPLRPVLLPPAEGRPGATAAPWLDCDTPADLAAARAAVASSTVAGSEAGGGVA